MQKSYNPLCSKCGYTVRWHSVETNQCPIIHINGEILFSEDTFTLPQQGEKVEGEKVAEQAKPKDAVTEAVEFFNRISENMTLDSGCIAMIGSISVYIFDTKQELDRYIGRVLPAYMGQLPNKQFIAVFN